MKQLLSFLSSLILFQVIAQSQPIYYAGMNINSPITKDIVGNQKSSCDTIRVFEANSIPSGLTFEEEDLWFGSWQKLYKITAEGEIIDSLPNPNYGDVQSTFNGGGLEFDGSYLWLVHENFGLLRKIDPQNGTVIETFQLPSFGSADPNIFGIGIGNDFFWFPDPISRELFKLDPINLSIIETYQLSNGIIDLEFIDGHLYGVGVPEGLVLTGDRYLYRIDTEQGILLDSVEWCVPVSTGLTADDTYLWNASGSTLTVGTESIYKIDFNANTLFIDNNDVCCELTLYPNPTNGLIFFRTNEEIVKVIVSDASGKQLKDFRDVDYLDISSWSQGLYFIRVEFRNGRVTQRRISKF
ncbi:MAG: T9SS type A sorting domain-containing protein [Cryomorphaceae bacterium]